MAFSKLNRRAKIKRRIRKRVFGTASVPRLSVYRSNKQIYVQLINDIEGKTIVAASSYKNEDSTIEGKNKIEQATIVGTQIAQRAIQAGIEKVVFDRNGYLYHGRVKALADSARQGGLKF